MINVHNFYEVGTSSGLYLHGDGERKKLGDCENKQIVGLPKKSKTIEICRVQTFSRSSLTLTKQSEQLSFIERTT